MRRVNDYRYEYMDYRRTHGVTASPAVLDSLTSSSIVYSVDVCESKATSSVFVPTGRFVAKMTGLPCFNAPFLLADAAGALVEIVLLLLHSCDFIGSGIGAIVISGTGVQL